MNDDAFDPTWLTGFASSMGLEPPDDATCEALLDLAGRAAHGSGDRRNAPLACFLLGRRLGTDGTEPDAAAVASY